MAYTLTRTLTVPADAVVRFEHQDLTPTAPQHLVLSIDEPGQPTREVRLRCPADPLDTQANRGELAAPWVDRLKAGTVITWSVEVDGVLHRPEAYAETVGNKTAAYWPVSSVQET